MSWLTQASVGPYYALEIRNEMDTMLAANGWVLVDDWVLPATGWQLPSGVGATANSLASATQKVWRNPAANNDSGIDFYVACTVTDIAHATPSLQGTVLALGIAEAYDPGTHKATKFAPYASSNSTVVGPDWTHSAPACGFGEALTVKPAHAGLNMAEVTTPYAITITNNYVAVSKGLQHAWVGRALPVGTPLAGDELLFEACGISSTTTPFGHQQTTTRVPSAPGGSPTYNWYGSGQARYYGLADVTAQDIVTGLPRGSELFLTDYRALSAVRGVMDGVLALPIDGTIGDVLTVTIRGVVRTFHRAPHATSRIWLERV